MIEQVAPIFSAHEAKSLAAKYFGQYGQVTELPSHIDQNFRVETSRDSYVLKVANSAADESYVDLQLAILTYLQKTDLGQKFPPVILTVDGHQKVNVSGVNGENHQIWMVKWLAGRPLATVNPVLSPLLQDFGRFLGSLTQTLEGFSHPFAYRSYVWDIRRATRLVEYLDYIVESEKQELVSNTLETFDAEILPKLDQLRTSIIHHDANDHNVIVQGTGYQSSIRGLIDFGDALHTATIVEIAIAVAYVMMGRSDPVGAAAEVIKGYHQVYPLEESEISVLYGLILARICSSVLVSAYRGEREPKNEYVRVSEQGAWNLLMHLSTESASLAEYRWRSACEIEPYPKNKRLVKKLSESRFAPVMQPDLRAKAPLVLDLSVSSSLVGPPDQKPDPEKASKAWFRRIQRAGAEIGIGRYNEARIVYTADHYQSTNNEFDERRTIHLGIDLFKEAQTPIYAPATGSVYVLEFSNHPMDFGGLIILKHQMDDETFYTLYGHLSQDSVHSLQLGQKISKGQPFAYLGTPKENGGWIPHLHFQVIADLLDQSASFWGVAPASQRDVWLSICPDPNLILGIQDDSLASSKPSSDTIRSRRKDCIGGNLTLSYQTPLHIVRGYRQYLYDETGREFLDAVNNVPHVGHSHPKVNAAAIRQMQVLNTNTRYLHQTLVDYAERLAATMPDPLSICYFVNSGSEANDLALRLAYAHTRRKDMIVLDGAYHGHLSSLISISPYKFNGPGGTGAPSNVHLAPVPDVYRGAYRDDDAGRQYANALKSIVEPVSEKVAAFICESLIGCGGQIELPTGYLRSVYDYVRSVGAVCIADEVQIGFGRVGHEFWGFETQQVIPDIVVLGKPMGNGHPLAGVVTRPEIAQSFDNGMEFFSTFGGNPVSCMVGMAVLDVIESEKLQENARITGSLLKQLLTTLKNEHPIMGDVRGQGLFLGVELVRHPGTLEPADREADYIINRMRDRGILISTDGPLHNVLKIKPPLVFNESNAVLLTEVLDSVLQEDGARVN